MTCREKSPAAPLGVLWLNTIFHTYCRGLNSLTSTIQPQIGLDSAASSLPAHFPSFAESPAASLYLTYP
ncbi:MAG TPA: hypothetical protein VLR10_00465 [Nitrososphaeraceae archaeon]|nr:hypothetical protein [Nitrososphaeraceae archaeon]